MPRSKTIADEPVLDAALEVLVERGPHRLTLRAVGQAVGLSPSTLAQRFGSKRGLLEAALGRATEQLEGTVATMPHSADPRADLLRWMAELSRANRTREQIAGNLALLIDDITDERRRALTQRHMAAIRRGVEAKLRAMGSPQPGPHVDMLEAHWHGLMIQWALHGEGSLERWIADGLGRLLDALGL